MFLALISAETQRYEPHTDLNVLWSWELGNYILSSHFPLELFLLFKLMLGVFSVCWPLYTPFLTPSSTQITHKTLSRMHSINFSK